VPVDKNRSSASAYMMDRDKASSPSLTMARNRRWTSLRPSSAGAGPGFDADDYLAFCPLI